MMSRIEQIREELRNLDKSAEFRQWVSGVAAIDDDSEFAKVLQHIASGYCYDLAFYLCIRYNAVLMHTSFGHFFVECDGLFFDGVTPEGAPSIPELNYFKLLSNRRLSDASILYSVRAASGRLIWRTSITVAMRMCDRGVTWIDRSTVANLDLLRMSCGDGLAGGIDLRGSLVYTAFNDM